MGFTRVFFALAFLALSFSAVNAYTVVMRDERRVEIPNNFTVTVSTLTYQVSNGFQITIQLNAVDIAATERANGETAGSLLMKAKAPKTPVNRVAQTSPGTARRSITNADLEKYRRARVESEDKRHELGLPSLEERQREVAAIDERLVEQARTLRAQEEAYWRSRTEALRAEMALNQAQSAWRQPAPDVSWSYPFGGLFPFDNVGFGVSAGRFNRFRQFPSSPFDGFLATPITRFPDFSFNPVFRGRFRGPVFGPGRGRVNPRPNHMRHGPRK